MQVVFDQFLVERKARRVIVPRRRIEHDIAMTAKRDDVQLVLAPPHDSLELNAKLRKYSALATNAEYDIAGRPGTCIAAKSRRALWRWSTTIEIGTCAPPIRARAEKR